MSLINAAGGLHSVLIKLLILLPLASSIYIDPVTNQKTYPHMKVVVGYHEQIGGEAPREQLVTRDIMVPLSNYQDYKVNLTPSEDPALSRYLKSSIHGYGKEGQPHLMVTMSGTVYSEKREQVIYKMEPPDGAQFAHCWFNHKSGRILLNAEMDVTTIECLAIFYNRNFVDGYMDWLFGVIDLKSDREE